MEIPVIRAGKRTLLVPNGKLATLFLVLFLVGSFATIYETSALNATDVILTYLGTVLCSIAFLFNDTHRDM